MHFSSVISLCLLALGHGAAAQYSLSQGNRDCAPGGVNACRNKGQYCVVATDTGYAEMCAVSCAASSTCASECRKRGKAANCVVNGNWKCVCS